MYINMNRRTQFTYARAFEAGSFEMVRASGEEEGC